MLVSRSELSGKHASQNAVVLNACWRLKEEEAGGRGLQSVVRKRPG